MASNRLTKAWSRARRRTRQKYLLGVEAAGRALKPVKAVLQAPYQMLKDKRLRAKHFARARRREAIGLVVGRPLFAVQPSPDMALPLDRRPEVDRKAWLEKKFGGARNRYALDRPMKFSELPPRLQEAFRITLESILDMMEADLVWMDGLRTRRSFRKMLAAGKPDIALEGNAIRFMQQRRRFEQLVTILPRPAGHPVDARAWKTNANFILWPLIWQGIQETPELKRQYDGLLTQWKKLFKEEAHRFKKGRARLKP
ncbi:MAG TPA: hypothetical protein HA252_01370 [Candidatus Diapherotrites archaeon]|uniref:Uncharacterized protein n=1 Tax=Candidatus Iainarchaeum sp. TaxID=3101447 RepID=A0A7J4JFF8_9ARCH|nr:hypothetical protein [Candidatus Diapherotrites archaeon]HIH16034.1 hypothetical protein [Candidatus Diapherotrites archaeon]